MAPRSMMLNMESITNCKTANHSAAHGLRYASPVRLGPVGLHSKYKMREAEVIFNYTVELKRWCKINLITVIIVFSLAACNRDNSGSTVQPVSAAKPTSSASKTNILEPDSWSFPGIVESARKIAPRNIEGRDFGSSGMAYSMAEIKSLPIATLPPQELQKYADIVTHAYPDAVFRQLGGACNDMPTEEFNITSVAGIAYVSLHAVDLDTRQSAALCLSGLQIKLKTGKSSLRQ